MKLTRTNKMVYRKYCKANSMQQKQMRHVLKEQIDNLLVLSSMMSDIEYID